MLEEREVITAVLGLCALAFLLANRRKVRRGLGLRCLSAALALAVAGWWLSVFEGFFWMAGLNLLEHSCYTLSSVALAAWALDAGRRGALT